VVIRAKVMPQVDLKTKREQENREGRGEHPRKRNYYMGVNGRKKRN